MARRLQPWVVALATAAVAVVMLSALPREVFWGTDSGNRYIQLQQFNRTGSITIDDPSKRIESSGAFTPSAAHHFLRKGNDLYSFYSPWFSLISAPFQRVLGSAGLFVLPLLATVVLILLFGGLHREFFGNDFAGIAAAALVLASPTFFYTLVFWEHSLAMALSTAGILLVLRRRPVAAGVLVALSTVLREEGYIALASVAIALLALTEMRPMFLRFAVASLAVLVPLWIMNFSVYGHVLGLHAAVYAGMHSGPGELATNFPVYLLRYTSSPAVQIAVAAPLVALLLLSGARGSRSIQTMRTILLYVAAAGALFSVATLAASAQPMRETLFTQALFGALPWTAIAFAGPRSVPRFPGITIAAALLITPLLLHQRDIGVVWGPRHFLWLIPLLLLAARAAVPSVSPRARPAIALLVVAAIAIQIFGVSLLIRKLQFSQQLLEAVRTGGAEVLVTDVFWVPEDLAALWFEKELVMVRSDDELAWVVSRLRSRGVTRVDYIASRPYRMISNRALSPLLRHATSRLRIGGSEPMLDVMVVRLTLR
ncbi:MAG: hypothetical protein ACXW2P_00505 [Thermoanaerobaculia bacterium]